MADPAAAAGFVLRAGLALLPGDGFVEDVAVVVRGGVIEDVLPGGGADGPAELLVLEAPGASLLPGFIDPHAHLTFSGGDDPVADLAGASDVTLALRAAQNAQHALARGVTTVADCGARGGVVIELRDAVARGEVLGPRILAAGAPITTTAGHCSWLGACADSLDEVVREARRQVAAGADFLKIMLTGGNMTPGSNPAMLQYPDAVLLALAAEAKRLARPLVVHAHSEHAVALAAEAGVAVVAHATCRTGDHIGISGETMAALLRNEVAVDPTITVGMPHDTAEPLSARAKLRLEMLPVFAEMRRQGVPLLAGTDAGVRHVGHGASARAVLSLHEDLGAGIEEALLSASALAARALGLAGTTGSIAPGLAADLVLVEGDVREAPGLLREPGRVWSRGRLVAEKGALRPQSS
jgi:imidazolonepropionase-like amidohydrolase